MFVVCGAFVSSCFTTYISQVLFDTSLVLWSVVCVYACEVSGVLCFSSVCDALHLGSSSSCFWSSLSALLASELFVSCSSMGETPQRVSEDGASVAGQDLFHRDSVVSDSSDSDSDARCDDAGRAATSRGRGSAGVYSRQRVSELEKSYMLFSVGVAGMLKKISSQAGLCRKFADDYQFLGPKTAELDAMVEGCLSNAIVVGRRLRAHTRQLGKMACLSRPDGRRRVARKLTKGRRGA